jgi:hypothetical protein
MSIPKLLLAAVAAFGLLGADRAGAGPTEQEAFQKKVARYAQPQNALDFSKPRGMCTCGPNASTALAGQTGALAYGYQSAAGISILEVTCEIPAFNTAGAIVASQTCDDWTLLTR